MENPDNSTISGEARRILLKQKYQLIRKAGAAKKCLYVHNSFRKNILCYKSTYGIVSHRCIQMTPVPPNLCTHRCLFCWRPQGGDYGSKEAFLAWDAAGRPESVFDPPKNVAEGAILAQRRIVSGYKPFVSDHKWEEARRPIHAAISLAGEPLLYPWMPELVQEFANRKISTFLVTNGTNPEGLAKFMDQEIFPTQSYVTLPAPNSRIYHKVCRPMISNGWEALKQSLKFLGEFPTRTVVRLTVGKKLNMSEPEQYAKLIEEVRPSFVEVKGVVHVGSAQKRIPRETMPTHSDIKAFSAQINETLNYKAVGEKEDSQVLILSSGKHPPIIPGFEKGSKI
ncbi:MAG: 4-demethylwyosine synthase TYW1 [Candidatus Heimdallarchaeota archaeon]